MSKRLSDFYKQHIHESRRLSILWPDMDGGERDFTRYNARWHQHLAGRFAYCIAEFGDLDVSQLTIELARLARLIPRSPDSPWLSAILEAAPHLETPLYADDPQPVEWEPPADA